MWQEDKRIKLNEKGQVAIIAIIVISLLLVSVVFAISKISLTNYEMSDISLHATQAYFLAESGLEDAIYRMKSDINYAGGSYETPIGDYSITVTNMGTYYTIRSEGVSNDVVRAVTSDVTISVESERITDYTVFGGDDVWMYWGNAVVNGDVWANDDINFSSNAIVNGNVTSAGRGSFFTSWVTSSAKIQDNPATATIVEGNLWSVNDIKVTTSARVSGDAYSEGGIYELLGGNVVGSLHEYDDLLDETVRIDVPSFDFDTYKALAQSQGTYYSTATQFENYVKGRDNGSTRALPDGVYYIENGNVFFNPGHPIVLNGSIVTEGEIRFYCGITVNALNNLPAIAAAKDMEFRDYGWPTYGGDNVTINGVLFSERSVILRHDHSDKLIQVNGAAWGGDDLRIENAAEVNFLEDVVKNVDGFGFTSRPGEVTIDNWRETL